MRRSKAITMLAAVLALACAACHREVPSADAASVDDPEAQARQASSDHPASRPPMRDEAGAEDALSHAPHPVDLPTAATKTAPIAEGAEVAYQCEDGNLVVVYAQGTARITLPDGGTGVATLSKPASTRLGGEFYGGAGLALQRLGNTVQLQQGDGPQRRCTEASSTG